MESADATLHLFSRAFLKLRAGKLLYSARGTDGIDGNSPAAGAIADGETQSRAHSLNLDPRDFLRRSDAYNFFERLGDAIVTGPTGNNLRDLRISPLRADLQDRSTLPPAWPFNVAMAPSMTAASPASNAPLATKF